VVAGCEAGFRSILIEHGHNMNHEFDNGLDVTVAKTWEEIYDIVR